VAYAMCILTQNTIADAMYGVMAVAKLYSMSGECVPSGHAYEMVFMRQQRRNLATLCQHVSILQAAIVSPKRRRGAVERRVMVSWRKNMLRKKKKRRNVENGVMAAANLSLDLLKCNATAAEEK